MTRRWSQRHALRELESLVTAVPKPTAGGGTKSSAASGFISYAIDMSIVQEVTSIVLKASNCPPEHPLWGDDGVREALIERAIEVLAWARCWLNQRNADEWGQESLVRKVLDPLRETEIP